MMYTDTERLQCDTNDEVDQRDDDDDRSNRFVETVTDNPELLKSKSLNKLKPFYCGVNLDERMADIRASIYYIRQHWDEYPSFLLKLKHLLIDQDGFEIKDKRTRDDLDILLSTKRDWLTNEEAMTRKLGYEAVKVYTSKEGHGHIYRLSNDIFRKATLMSIETIRSMVFLVELINIDLYNYCLKCPEQKNFEDVVYRGICLAEDDLIAFKALREEPLGSRNIAVPLGG